MDALLQHRSAPSCLQWKAHLRREKNEIELRDGVVVRVDFIFFLNQPCFLFKLFCEFVDDR